MLEKKATGLGLILTGGSDWHYEGGRFGLGDFYVETSRMKPFLALVGASYEFDREN
jgi:hypothetical protein